MHNELLKEQLVIIDGSLSSYLEVHDIFFQQHLGQEIDYPTLLEKMRISINILESVESQFINLLLLDDHIIVRYTGALKNAQEQLFMILKKLKEKSEGNSYGFFAYHKDVKKYESAQKEYHGLGNELIQYCQTLI
jgi:hypothetical protein